MEDPSERLNGIVAKCTVTESPGGLIKKGTGNNKGGLALDSSQKVLQQLKQDGCDLIGSLDSSSAVRTVRQLIQRNKSETECRNLTDESGEKVRITDGKLQEQWKETESITAPHQLIAEITGIKETSGGILNAQQELINRLRDELGRAESGIQQEIERQTDDLGVMRRRMREHLDTTRACHHAQLREINDAMNEDYSQLLSDHSTRMDEMLAEWSSSEDRILKELAELGDRWDDDLTETDEQYYRQARDTRRLLTADIQLIERELERLKTSFILNNEVLDYGCRILKLREEERSAVAFRQKRRMARLTERFRQLKEELDQTGKERDAEENKLAKEVEQLRKDCRGMERKFGTIKSANDAQLESVCRMAEDRISELLKKLAMIDERIFEEVLEQPWDGLVGGLVSPDSTSTSQLDAPELEEVMENLEKNLGFLLMTGGQEEDPPVRPEERRERLRKALDLSDDQELRALLSSLRPVKPREVTNELARKIRSHKVQSVDPSTVRTYLTDASTIRAHFGRFKDTAVPPIRLRLWKMLSRALIQYERILRDRLILAADLLKS